MRLGYFPGCSLHGTAREFDESLRAVAGRSGSSSRRSTTGRAAAPPRPTPPTTCWPWRCRRATSRSPRRRGTTQVLAPCAACYNRLAAARHEIEDDAALAGRIPELLGRPFANSVAVRNVVEVLRELAPAINAEVGRSRSRA